MLTFAFSPKHHTVPKYSLTELLAWLETHVLVFSVSAAQCFFISLCAFLQLSTVTVSVD